MSEHFIKDWVIPFYQGKIKNWKDKRLTLLSLYNKNKHNMLGGEQYTDYDQNNNYHSLVEGILFDDIKDAIKELGYENMPMMDMSKHKTSEVTSAWFQHYDRGQHHPAHNHGLGGLSFVCFIEYDSNEHVPTTFISPFTNLWDGNVLDYTPKNIEEGSFLIFPASLTHCVLPNTSDVRRLILSFNIS
jgi:hypothetical protein